MTMFAKWLGARIQWSWCALLGHILSVPHKANRNNRHGQIAAMESWMSCRCGQKIGMIVRRPYTWSGL